MSEQPEIHLLTSFCGLGFGQTLEQAVQQFGEPEEVQNLADEILNTSSIVYHYWELGFSLFFDPADRALRNVEVDNREALLFGMKVFQLREKELVELMKQNGHPLCDSEVHAWGEKRLSFDSAALDCYFENNRMVSLNFGAPESDKRFDYFPN